MKCPLLKKLNIVFRKWNLWRKKNGYDPAVNRLNRLMATEYFKKNGVHHCRVKYEEARRKYQKKGVEELSDFYIKRQLKRAFGITDISDNLIEIKRTQLQLKRKIRERQRELNAFRNTGSPI